MRRRFGLILTLAAVPACASNASTAPLEHATATPVSHALAALESDAGPKRFGVVTPTLYRGGQPTEDHMRLLHALGVTKIVTLRRERLDLRYAERATARELGMEMVELPFYGVFGVHPDFLTEIVGEMQSRDGGAVYVHCDNGRDRTSLVVALYRVMVDGWAPEQAWEREALAYGQSRQPVFREIRFAFEEHVLEHSLRGETRTAGPDRAREVSSLRNGTPPAR